MIRRVLLVCVAIAGLCPAAADDDRAVEIALANALHSGDSKVVLKLFNPKMSGYAEVRADIQRLLQAAEVGLDINRETGIWSLEITARDLATGVTHRKAKVSIRTEGGLIQVFQPAGFFAPPHGREAWDTLFVFAAALQNEDAAPDMRTVRSRDARLCRSQKRSNHALDSIQDRALTRFKIQRGRRYPSNSANRLGFDAREPAGPRRFHAPRSHPCLQAGERGERMADRFTGSRRIFCAALKSDPSSAKSIKLRNFRAPKRNYL